MLLFAELGLIREVVAYAYNLNVSSKFSSRDFKVLGHLFVFFSFRSIIHFELIFLQDEKYGSKFHSPRYGHSVFLALFFKYWKAGD